MFFFLIKHISGHIIIAHSFLILSEHLKIFLLISFPVLYRYALIILMHKVIALMYIHIFIIVYKCLYMSTQFRYYICKYLLDIYLNFRTRKKYLMTFKSKILLKIKNEIYKLFYCLQVLLLIIK